MTGLGIVIQLAILTMVIAWKFDRVIHVLERIAAALEKEKPE